jgi:signal transduction histidine kinase/HD-like signal output (HDOD) protein
MPNTRILKLRRPAAVPTLRLPCLRETATAILRVLSVGTAATHDIARIIVLDPVLVFELLLTEPLADNEPASLLNAIARRVDNIDSGLLQAWALRHIIQQPRSQISLRTHHHHALHSQFVAELAVHLAHETGYAMPDQAYAAGLLHDIGLLWLAEYADDYPALLATTPDERSLTIAEWDRYAQDHADLSSDLASRCGMSAGIADAIALQHADPEALGTAHPLVRIIAAAEELASSRGNQSVASLEIASRLTQLDSAILVSLLADTTRSVQDKARTLGIQADPTMLALPWSTSTDEGDTTELIDNGIARAALHAFSRSALIDAPTAWQDFNLASRLLLGMDAPVLFVKTLGNDGLTGAANPAHPGLTQIHIATDDANSVIAEAYRDSVETRFQSGQRPPGRCAADWQLARWLDSDGLLCVPWINHHESGVAVFPCPSTEDPGLEVERSLRKTLTQAATSRISERSADQRTRHQLEESVARRYVDHARRIAHEASNPLTVIKTYLGIIDEKIDDATLKEQLNLLSDELDRVGALIRKASDFSCITPPGPAHSGVGEILHDLRALYGEALFARRGIQFELRTSPSLPAAAIAPDALKQILLNLFKNAAEALPEGGKLTVSAVAGINANGSPCLEIRIVDNGPGLSPERVQSLFAGGPKSSDKPGGSGVGLPVVRELVTTNGGTILCRSQLGSGTVFQIFMPLAATP